MCHFSGWRRNLLRSGVVGRSGRAGDVGENFAGNWDFAGSSVADLPVGTGFHG